VHARDRIEPLIRSMQKPDQRQTGVISPWKLNLFQVGTQLMRIGHAGMHCRERPKTIRYQPTAFRITAKKAIASSIAAISVASATAITTRRCRRRRILRDCPFATSAPPCASASVCSPQCAHAIFRLGGNHDESQIGLPCLVTTARVRP
jgi:hypothetical protein